MAYQPGCFSRSLFSSVFSAKFFERQKINPYFIAPSAKYRIDVAGKQLGVEEHGTRTWIKVVLLLPILDKHSFLIRLDTDPDVLRISNLLTVSVMVPILVLKVMMSTIRLRISHLKM